MTPAGSRVSVIVPTLDEEAEVGEALRRAREAFGSDAELIVVDGGSRDGTTRIAARHATVLRSARGRGEQLAAGADAAEGDILVFLHADTWVSADAGARVAAAIRAGAAGGCLRFAVREDRRLRTRLLELGVNTRTRIFATATGDQAIFARRDAYARCGGIPRIPIFEDVRFVRRLRRVGRFVPTNATAVTSGRRWNREGFLRTVILHLGLRAAFALGASPERLARHYGRGRFPPGTRPAGRR